MELRLGLVSSGEDLVDEDGVEAGPLTVEADERPQHRGKGGRAIGVEQELPRGQIDEEHADHVRAPPERSALVVAAQIHQVGGEQLHVAAR